VGLVLDAVEAAGGRLFFLKDSLDSSIPGHRMVIVMVSEQARAESANTSVRVTAKNEANVAAGLPVPGRRRFGYLGADKATGRGVNIKAHPEEAEVVRMLFNAYAGGESVRALGLKLGWRPVRVRDTLSNPSYAGFVVRQGQRYPAHESVDRIIDPDLFERVQVRLFNTAKASRGGGDGKIKHLASGVVARCAVCGGRAQFTNGYLCSESFNHFWIKKEYLETRIYSALVDVFMDPTFSLGDDPAAGNLGALESRLKALNDEKAAALAMTEDRELDLSMADIAPTLKRIAAEKAPLEAQRDRVLQQSVQAQVLQGLVHSVALNEAGQHLFLMAPTEARGALELRIRGLDIEKKRELCKGLLDITVAPGRGSERVTITRKKKPDFTIQRD
jgi:hypothetical protein